MSRGTLLALLLYAALALGAARPGLDGAFDGDDFIWLYDAAHVHAVADLLAVHDVPFAHYDGVRLNPTTNLFFAVGWRLFALDPRGYHVVALLLYIATAAFVRAWLHEIGLGDTAALLGGMCFLLHPLHAQPIGWLSAIGEVLVGLGTIGALWAWVRWRREGRPAWLALSTGFLLFGVLAKESALVVPLVLLLADVLIVHHHFRLRRYVLPFGIALLTAAWKQGILLRVRDDIGIHPLSLSAREVLGAAYSYLAGCVVGFDAVREGGESVPLMMGVVGGCGLALAILLMRGHRRAGFHLAWLLIAVQPYVWWVPGHLLFDRYAYQPSLPLACGLACVLDVLLRTPRRGVRRTILVLAAAGMGLLAFQLGTHLRAIHRVDDLGQVRASVRQALSGLADDETVYVYNLPTNENASGRALVLMGDVSEAQVRDWYDALALAEAGPLDRFVFYDEQTRRYLDLTDSVRGAHATLRGRLAPASHPRDHTQDATFDFSVTQQMWRDMTSPPLEISPFALYRVEVWFRGPLPPTLCWTSGDSGSCDPREVRSKDNGTQVAIYDPGARRNWWTGGVIHTISLRGVPPIEFLRVRLHFFGNVR